ncbi:MAG: acetaldehyde dehydrogenase (acetylating) [Candidatus Omnitrophica bacterium]|nr:acetaldehyde dehydrogenase (acetylating) [Candidatus Omnitrophota bacterium]
MKLRVAILGSGNIGTDLLIKTLRSSVLECALFVGRHADSPGLTRARDLGVNVSDRGIDKLLEEPRNYDLVFDATNAIDHRRHWAVLKDLGKTVIDLTPSRVGKMHIPAVDEGVSLDQQNVNMVSCGGQAAVPLAYLIGKTQRSVEYIEVVSSIASRGAGPGTRINIDEYVETTEEAIRAYSGCERAKTILILNPAKPDVNMQVTVSAKVKNPDLESLRTGFGDMVKKIQSYVPGYQIVVPPIWESNRIVASVKILGRGDYLPPFAGNLDIMNCAAIATAEKQARKRVESALCSDK